MTYRKNIRAIALAALVVLSVVTVVGSVSGQAAGPDFRKATHYNDPQDGTIVEVAFTKDMQDNSLNNITLYAENGSVINPSGSITEPNNNGRVVIPTSGVVPKIDTIKVPSSVKGAGGNAVENTGNHSVEFAAAVQSQGGSNQTVYTGESIALTNNNVNQNFRVDGPGFSARRGTGAGSQVLVLGSADELGSETGQYQIDWDDDGSFSDDNSGFRVADLNLQASVDETQVNTGETFTATASANPSSRHLEFRLVDDGGDTVQTVRKTTDASTAEAEADLSASKKGTYTVEVEDLYAGVTVETQNVTVGKSNEQATFGKPKLISDQQGDVVNITVNLQDTDTGTVTIGSPDVGYTANVTVEDGANGDSDNTVTLQWNTYLAGTQGNPKGSTFDVVDSDDDLTVVDETNFGSNNLIDTGDYPIEVRAGSDETVAADDVGTVNLGERSTESIALWRAPEDTDNVDTPGEVADLVDNGNLTHSTQVAQGDWAVAQVSASGLEGLMASNGWQRGDGSATSAFNDSVAGDHLAFNVNETNAGPNSAPEMVNLSASIDNDAVDVVYDAEGDTFYVFMDTSNLVLESGNQISVSEDEPASYEVNFTVQETKDSNKQLASDDQTLSADLTIEEGTGSIEDATGQPAEGQTVSGTTNYAPGTELTVRAKSSTFITEGTAIVTQNGTYTATLDYSEGQAGDNVTATLIRSGTELDDMDFTLQEEQTTTQETTQETTQQTTQETTESTTMATTESTTESGGTPGFTVAIGLVALIGAALLALRRER